MPSLRNTHANMEIGWCYVGTKKQLYIQNGNVREYYGYLLAGKADKFFEDAREMGRERR